MSMGLTYGEYTAMQAQNLPLLSINVPHDSIRGPIAKDIKKGLQTQGRFQVSLPCSRIKS